MRERKNRKFMLHAIRIAQKAVGKTFPNPLVGAVLVKSGKIIAEGYHKKAGLPHAEITALKKAGKNAKDSCLYVSLEPCAHYGKTPPCVRSIIKSGVKKVFAAMQDPNPVVSGKGLEALRKSGVIVKTGPCRKEAEEINIVYSEFIKTQKEDRCLRG